MILINEEQAKKLPPLYSNDNKDFKDVKVLMKFFVPWGTGTWYLTEYNPETKIAFGYAIIFEGELGYFSIEEMELIRGPGGLTIERDEYWDPETTLQEVLDGKKR